MPTHTHIAMMAQQPLPASAEGGDAPEWIHLLPAPADGLLQTADNRGPYRLERAELQAIIDRSFERAPQIEIDINHATYLAAKNGGRSDAVGWIVEMQAREDGIWGRVDWTPEGRRLVADRAYRAISPVLMADRSKTVASIANASLVNRPNLRGLAALNSEEALMDEVLAKLKKMLGLAEDAETEEIYRSLSAVIDAAAAEKAKAATSAELQSQLGEIGVVLGLPKDAAPKDVLAAAKTAKAGGGKEGELIAALQSELTEMASELETLKSDGAKARAETFVDGAIRDGRHGVAPKRELYVSMHMENPARTEELVAGLPKIRAGAIVPADPPSKDGEIHLNAEQADAARLLGIPRDDYAKTLAAERQARDSQEQTR
ncbi:phage protease [Albimonas sp. CAU 1670]|uniref:phage protease n=1 Tax=Albimonas sp. CAU 1670 TaxID=3032599 RepID=UPI0023DB002C|nr:phage protease [Albimonas sp. CAU 1670]MDF2232181.1 phage protease [Albimonas sp. CAU 1670]